METGGGRGCLDIDIVTEEEAEGGLERKALMAMPVCKVRMGRRQRAFFRFRWVEASVWVVCVGLTLVMPVPCPNRDLSLSIPYRSRAMLIAGYNRAIEGGR
jgi:hypothetical protein